MNDAGAFAANLQQQDADSFEVWLAEKVGESELITPLIAARIRGGAA